MRVLITGGAGFIGSQTVRVLTRGGHSVAVLDNFSRQVHGTDRERSPTWVSIRDQVELVEGDVRDAALLQSLVPGFDAVLHLAAETGTGQSMYAIDHYSEVNVGGTARLLEAVVKQCGRVRHVVVASSRSVYGEGTYQCAVHGEVFPASRQLADLQAGHFDPRCPRCGNWVAMSPTTEDAPLRPASVYAVTKLAQEQLTLAVCTSVGVAATALRYQNVYGPGQSLSNPYTGILSIFAREMLGGREIEVFEDGEESRDFVHVEDVARINAQLLTGEREGGAVVLNVGTGRAVSVNQVAAALAAALGSPSRVRVSGRFRAGDIRHNVADLSRLRAQLGEQVFIAFDDGIARFAAWATGELAGAGDDSRSAYARSLAELESRGLMGTARDARGGAA